MNWLFAFVITCLIELTVVASIARRSQRKTAAIDSLAANLLTHPAAWYLIRSIDLPWLAVELTIVAVEASIYRTVTRMSWGRAATAAICANGITAALSFVV
mgnify:CR=1 FL=1